MSEEERVTKKEAVEATGKIIGYMAIAIVAVVSAFALLTALIAPLVP